MTSNFAAKGLKIRGLLIIASIFLLFHVISLGIERRLVPDIAQASFGNLSFVIILEILSWAAYPLLAFCFLIALEHLTVTRDLVLLTLGLSVVSECAEDFARSGRLIDMRSQSFVWAFVLCIICYQALKSKKVRSRPLVAVAIIVAALLWAFIAQLGVRFSGFVPGAILLVFFLVFFYLKGRENTMMLSAALMGATFAVAPAFGVVFLHYRAPSVEIEPQFPPAWILAAYPVALIIAGF
ncbi:hypothetical protein NXT01_03510 [Corynebacterium sp. ES2775-CONJ]|nr:hypothetical protein [Corynebacterium sp. ES2775-CONJ]